MKYLGIDYGLKKVGLAISEGFIASPLKVIEVNSLQDAINKVKAVCLKEQIDLVIVGMAESGESRKIARNFVNELRKDYEVFEMEESLTSKEAIKMMVELGLPKNQREKEDAYSAVLILENFLFTLNRERLTK